MINNKVGIFSAFLFVAVAALFFPATALEKSIANAQEEYYAEEEYYPQDNEKENNGYYDQAYDYYPSEHYKKKDPIVLVKKKLFVCDDAQNRPPGIFSFACLDRTPFQTFPVGPDSGEYIECL